MTVQLQDIIYRDAMSLTIKQITRQNLAQYGTIPMAFEVRSVLYVETRFDNRNSI